METLNGVTGCQAQLSLARQIHTNCFSVAENFSCLCLVLDCSCLAADFEGVLRLVLENDKSRMMPFEVFLHVCEDIVYKKVRRLACSTP